MLCILSIAGCHTMSKYSSAINAETPLNPLTFSPESCACSISALVLSFVLSETLFLLQYRTRLSINVPPCKQYDHPWYP